MTVLPSSTMSVLRIQRVHDAAFLSRTVYKVHRADLIQPLVKFPIRNRREFLPNTRN